MGSKKKKHRYLKGWCGPSILSLSLLDLPKLRIFSSASENVAPPTDKLEVTWEPWSVPVVIRSHNIERTSFDLAQHLLLKEAIVTEMLSSTTLMISKTDKIPCE